MQTIQPRPLRSISIHSARVGGDATEVNLSHRTNQFQSTPPVWAETLDVAEDVTSIVISIHSARVGGDRMSIGISFLQSNFNPLRPCGRRPGARPVSRYAMCYFNPLRPCGRRLCMGRAKMSGLGISIHSARVGGDKLSDIWIVIIGQFQSTPPVWAETSCRIYGSSL